MCSTEWRVKHKKSEHSFICSTKAFHGEVYLHMALRKTFQCKKKWTSGRIKKSLTSSSVTLRLLVFWITNHVETRVYKIFLSTAINLYKIWQQRRHRYKVTHSNLGSHVSDRYKTPPDTCVYSKTTGYLLFIWLFNQQMGHLFDEYSTTL